MDSKTAVLFHCFCLLAYRSLNLARGSLELWFHPIWLSYYCTFIKRLKRRFVWWLWVIKVLKFSWLITMSSTRLCLCVCGNSENVPGVRKISLEAKHLRAIIPLRLANSDSSPSLSHTHENTNVKRRINDKAETNIELVGWSSWQSVLWDMCVLKSQENWHTHFCICYIRRISTRVHLLFTYQRVLLCEYITNN